MLKHWAYKHGKHLYLKLKPQRQQLLLELVYIYTYGGQGNKVYFHALSHLAMPMANRDVVWWQKCMLTDNMLACYQHDEAM